MQHPLLYTLLGIATAAGAADVKDSVARFTLPSGITITIVESPVSGPTLPNCTVNGKSVRLGDYKPSTYVKRITAEYRQRSFALDSSCMSDAWNGRPLEVRGVIRYFGGGCKALSAGMYCSFRGVFADGSETFAAEWNVVSGRSQRTVLTGSQDVISLFSKNIDPPEYE